MDSWYREEHLDQMSKEPGFQRATRFELVFQIKNEVEPAEDAANYLTSYEFDGSNKLGKEVQLLEPMTEWTGKVIKNIQKVEMGVFHQIKAFK